jgi:hypothetical protein
MRPQHAYRNCWKLLGVRMSSHLLMLTHLAAKQAS